MANPQKPWKVEYAKSSRSSCKTCENPIQKENLRFGKMVQATQFDGFMPMWNHAACILKKEKQIKSIDDVEGLDLLRWEDQQKIRQYVEDSVAAVAVTPVECGIEVSQTSRANCKHCKQKIMKGEVRLSSAVDSKGAKGLARYHANCYIEQCPSTHVEKLAGWQNLPPSDPAAVSALVKKPPSAEKNEKQTTSKAGKRKKGTAEDQNSKVTRAVGDVSVSRSMKSAIVSADPQNSSDLVSKLEAQSKGLRKLKDDLIKHVTAVELREMLESNDQDSTGSELDLRDRCADGMMFGALAKCPICSGSLRYSGGMYLCHRYQSAWSKCSYFTREPERLKGKWKVPEETGNQYLSKWFKFQVGAKPIRLLPLPSTGSANGNQASNSQSQSSRAESFAELRVSFSGLKDSMGDWKRKIEGEGGAVHAKIKKDTNCLVVSGDVDENNTEIKKARRRKIPIVWEEYLVDCFRKQKKLPYDRYKVEATGESTSLVTVNVEGRSAVHESSGLQDTPLNMSYLSTGINRVLAHSGQEQETCLLLQADDTPFIGSSTERDATMASGSRSCSRQVSRGEKRRTRGHSRNLELDRHVNIHGRIRIEIDEEVGKPVCANATKFSNAIGTIARNTIPLRCKDWSDVSKEVRDLVVDQLLSYFDFDVGKKHVKKYVLQRVQNTFKEYRSDLYKHYRRFKDPKEARACPPKRITDATDWNLLCNRWETPEWKKKTETNKKSRSKIPYLHRTGSKSFVQVQSEMKIKEGRDVDQVDLFRQSHFCEKDGWVNNNAKDAYLEMQRLMEASFQEDPTPMSSVEVCKQVLGHRSGYIKGLGLNPKPSSSSSVTSYLQDKKELEKKMEKMEDEMIQMKANYEHMKETNVALTSQLSMWEGRWAEIQNMLGRGQGKDGHSNT
ncbi:poly [ADP-ribose] polymerase 1-like isoform X2 [Benincasa hispida]|uniref:poly [ADP-ribose] polymerase 1-like isoform X2 n=1 Tax=Benincasa hispida TaxID=102211 RepID=UPI0018FF6C6A|nr:poly [ADP-ribose] polymerase 1-like isoform X2 [Benincasa hispida]